MSCQKKINSYIKTNKQQLLNKLADVNYSDFEESRFETIDNFDFLAFFENLKKNIDKGFSKDYTRSKEVSDKIMSIVNSNKYSKRGDYSKEEYDKLIKSIGDKVNQSIKKTEKIGFVIPGFTTKAFNTLRVESRRLPDLAEFASLMRLYEICYQVGKIYHLGAEFVVITDGLAYAKIFGEDPYFAIEHRRTLEKWMRNLGIENTVKIIDLTSLLPKEFDKEYKKVAKELRSEWQEGKDMDFLANYIANTKSLVNFEEEIVKDMMLFYQLQNDHENRELDHELINQEIINKSYIVTFKYEVFLKTMYKLKVIEKALPNHIRCTGRPKPGQLGIYLIHERTDNFPWNGVGVLRKNGRVDVMPEYKAKYTKQFTPVFIKGDHSAFYYKEN